MPQREFWTEQHPTEVRWRYWVDLVDPEAPSQLTITTYDQAGKMMEHAGAVVPFSVTHEAIGDMLKESWQGYLFGDRHAGPRALRAEAKHWKQYARHLERLGL